MITSTNHPLHFLHLSDRDFERLCYWIAVREGYRAVEHIGASGADMGQDILMTKEGQRVVLQAKRYKEFGPSDAVAAEIKAKGVEFTKPPTTIRPGVRICFIRGPQGISIELLERDEKYT